MDNVTGFETGFDPASVPIKKAVSVLMIRQAPQLEVFVQHRVTTMDFAAGMVVYPGGRLDDVDFQAPVTAPENHAKKWARTDVGTDSVLASALLAAAVREVEEETGAAIPAGGLLPWANWTTPLGHKRRFDTYFYVIDATELAAIHQTTEATNSEWASVTRLHRDYVEHRIDMMRPTVYLLSEIMELGSVDAVVHEAKLRSINPVRPTGFTLEDAGIRG